MHLFGHTTNNSPVLQHPTSLSQATWFSNSTVHPAPHGFALSSQFWEKRKCLSNSSWSISPTANTNRLNSSPNNPLVRSLILYVNLLLLIHDSKLIFGTWTGWWWLYSLRKQSYYLLYRVQVPQPRNTAPSSSRTRSRSPLSAGCIRRRIPLRRPCQSGCKRDF